MNIIWKQPDGTVSVSYLTAEVESPADEAELLQQSGAVPADWIAVAYDYPLPTAFTERTWTWDEQNTVLAEDLQSTRAAKLQAINSSCEAALATLKADCPESEVSSWAKQEAEARALQSDPATPVPLLSAIATARGLEVAELAARVIAKADAYAIAAGALIGRRQALEDALSTIDLAAPDAEAQIDAIRWEGAA